MDDRYYALWDNTEPCARNIADEHLLSFVDAFVEQPRRTRWKQLMKKRGQKLFEISHKLEAVLDHSSCRRIDDVHACFREAEGVFYEFSDEPRWVSLDIAVALGTDRDAVFSITPGKRAILFSHEGRFWLCQK